MRTVETVGTDVVLLYYGSSSRPPSLGRVGWVIGGKEAAWI